MFNKEKEVKNSFFTKEKLAYENDFLIKEAELKAEADKQLFA
jgi:hypothetical protein